MAHLSLCFFFLRVDNNALKTQIILFFSVLQIEAEAEKLLGKY